MFLQNVNSFKRMLSNLKFNKVNKGPRTDRKSVLQNVNVTYHRYFIYSKKILAATIIFTDTWFMDSLDKRGCYVVFSKE